MPSTQLRQPPKFSSKSVEAGGNDVDSDGGGGDGGDGGGAVDAEGGGDGASRRMKHR